MPDNVVNIWQAYNLNAAPVVAAPRFREPPRLTRLEKPEYTVREEGEWVLVYCKAYEEEEPYVYWEFRTHQAEELAKLLQGWLVKRAHADTG